MAKNKKAPAKAAKKARKAVKTAAKPKKAGAVKAKKAATGKAKAAPKKVTAKKAQVKTAPRKAAPKAASSKTSSSKTTSTAKAAPKSSAAKSAAPKVPAPKAASPKPATSKAKPAPQKGSNNEGKKPAAKKAPATSAKQAPAAETQGTQAESAAKIAASAQLNFFQMPNQRPMAHKPAKPSTTSQDKTRYSEEELQEFQELINRKLEKAREEYKILKDTLNRTNDEGTDATSGGNTKVLEDGAETAEKENLSQLAARQQKYISNLENALIRIKNGTYGICSVTGKLISKERLIAVPHTTQSIEAKLMQQD